MSTSPQLTPYQLEHDDRRTRIIVVSMVLAGLATLFVVLRIWARRASNIAIKTDDFLIIASLFFAYGLCFAAFPGTHYGLGRHAEAVGMENVATYLKVQLSYEIIYNCCILTIKLSILFFYARIFPSRRFRLWLYGIGAFVVAWFITNEFCAVFQCDPPDYLWNKDEEGHCVDLTALLISLASLNIVTDVAILVAPVRSVWKLQISRKQKIALSGIFLLGSFVCVASIVRLLYLNGVGSDDLTWTGTYGSLWSTVEPCIGIVSACLPTLRPLYHSIRMRSSSALSSFRGSKTKNPESFGSGPKGMARRGSQKLESETGHEMDSHAGQDYNGDETNVGMVAGRNLGAKAVKQHKGWQELTARDGSKVTNKVTSPGGDAARAGHGLSLHHHADPRQSDADLEAQTDVPAGAIKLQKGMEWSEESTRT